MDWIEKLYSAQWTQRFMGRASSLYGHLDDYQTLAEDAASMTAMKLSGHSEQEATDALILSVFKNALTDCVRERHGFPRPRKWLDDLGEIGRRLFKVICLEGKTRQQLEGWVVMESDKTGQIPGSAPSIEDSQALAQSIFDKMQEQQECSPWRRHMARDNDDDEGAVSPFTHLSKEGDSPEDHTAFEQLRHFIEAIVGAGGMTGFDEADRNRIHALADTTWEQLGLDALDRMVMNAYMGRGLSDSRHVKESDIAQDLGLSVPKIRNRRKKVLSIMHELFS